MAKPNGTYHEPQGSQIVFPNRQSAVAIGSTQQRETATAVTRETEFAILPDGRMVDLVSSIRQPSKIEFLIWREGDIQLTSHIENDGELLIVPRIDPTVVSALRLPTMARPCPEIGELFPLLMNQIGTYVELSTEYTFLVAAFVLTTWFADRLSVVPYLTICGPPDSGKTRLVRLLHCLCRRAIHVSGNVPAWFCRLVNQVRPTLLIDDANLGRDIQRFLRGGNSQGSRVLYNGSAFDNFGPKVIASRVPLDDAALVSCSINIVMTPSDREVPSLDRDAEEKLSLALQPILETFRLLHYVKVAASQYPGFLKFPPGLRDNARALAAAMLGNEELEERLAGALESQIHSMQFDRFGEPEWVLMLALYGLCHVANGDLYVHTLTKETKRILRENGDNLFYSPKKVGHILNKSLGFTTRRRGAGYRFELTLAIRRKIHSLAKTMGIKRSDMLHWADVQSGLAGEPCSICSEFGMMMDHEGRRLTTLDELLHESMPCTNCGLQSHHEVCPGRNTPRTPAPLSGRGDF